MKRRDVLLGGAAATMIPIAAKTVQADSRSILEHPVHPSEVGSVRRLGGTIWVKKSLAKMLYLAIKERGILVGQMDRRFSKEGAKMGIESEFGTKFLQRNISMHPDYDFGQVQVELLADNIAIALAEERASPFETRLALVFAELVIPSAGVIQAEQHYFGEVAVRTIEAYIPGSDELVSRMDVIFAAAGHRQWEVTS
jgi:hypothetical protein